MDKALEIATQLVNFELTLVNDVVAELATAKDSIIELTTERDSLKAGLEELSKTTEAVLATEVETLKTQLSEVKESNHKLLATSVAVEMKRSNSPVANGKTLDALVEMLSKRSVDSLNDSYSDLLLNLGIDKTESTTITQVEKVNNPAHENREEVVSESTIVTSMAKIDALLRKHKMVENHDGTKVPAVTEDDPEKTILRTKPDGTMTIEVVHESEEDAELAKEVDNYTL